jgi:hypothetical protein
VQLIAQPDDVTAAAIKRLARDNADGQRLFVFLKQALADRDWRNRPVLDAIQLRLGQGAALALAQIIGIAEGQAGAGVLAETTALPRPARKSET